MRDELRLDVRLRAYRLAFERSATPALVFDSHGTVVVFNEAALEPAHAIVRACPVDELLRFRQDILETGWGRVEVGAEGRVHVLEGRRVDEFFLVTMYDATAARRADAELRTLRRVEAMGHLTTGLVQDYGDLLTPIVCLSACIEADSRSTRASREMARDIHAAAERASALTRQTLRMLRRNRGRVETTNLNAAISDLRPLVERMVGAHVNVEIQLVADATSVSIDREAFEHAVLNLAANAREAMRDGGTLTLATAAVWFDGDEGLEGSSRGRYVAVRVTDTGMGMTPAVRERIFERLYATEDEAEGPSMGLHSVRRFVSSSGGCMALQSEPGRGTTFSLYFPSVGPALRGHSSIRPRRGWERILVVDDEMAVRGAMRAVLEAAGYAVLEASDGREALSIVEGARAKVDLVVADVVMPRMDGLELAQRLRAADPTTKVLFTSGHTERALERYGLVADVAPVLLKAFTPAELLDRVRQTLDEDAGRAGACTYGCA